jgi:hypothetical protein
MPKLKPEEHVYIRSMGKVFKVQAICATVDEANALMRQRDELSVMASFDHDARIYLCDRYDHGYPVPPLREEVEA